MPKSKEQKDAEKYGPKLPDAVLKQGEVADKKIKGESPEPTNPEPTTPDPVEPNPVEPDPVKPEPTPPVNEPAKPSDWEQKYKVLKGKYDNEIGDLRQGINNLNNIIQQQNGMIESLQASQVKAPAQSPAKSQVPASDIKKLDPDDFLSYGDEIGWLVKGFNQLIEQNSALMNQLQSGSAAGGGDRFERVERMVQETATDRYMGHLDAAIPNWRQINDSAEFKAWLGTVNQMTNHRYGDILRYAANNLRHGQVIALFKQYAAEKNADLGVPSNRPAPNQRGIQRDNGVIDETVDPLAAQAVPDTAAGGGDDFTHNTPAGQQKGYPTAQEVAKASALYAKGKITMEKFNEISNQFQMGQKAAQK